MNPIGRKSAAHSALRRRPGDFLQQAAPTRESVPPGKISIKHGAGAMPHFSEPAGIRAKAAQRIQKLEKENRDLKQQVEVANGVLYQQGGGKPE